MIELTLEDPLWLDFVRGHAEATIFHHPAWCSTIEACYGHRPFFLALVNRSGDVLAGLPIVEVRGLRSRRWVSVPYADACPVLADESHLSSLLEAVASTRTEAGVRRVEIRGSVDQVGAHKVNRGFSHSLALDRDPESVERMLHTQVRRSLRRAEREGVVTRCGTQREDLLEVFYGLHLETRRRQGVPIQPRRFFEVFWDKLLSKGYGELIVAEVGGSAVAAAVFLRWNRTVIYKFGASNDDGRRVSANHAVMWHAITAASVSGYSSFDFGRSDSRNTGLRQFKAGWGSGEEPLIYSTIGQAPAQRSGRFDDLLAFAIKRSPLWVCRLTGEALYRYVA